MQHNNNVGAVVDSHSDGEDFSSTAQAFSHFTYERSGHQLLVCDIQGVGSACTDPQIHSLSGKGFGEGNLGVVGMRAFLLRHRCNAICARLRLEPVDPKHLNPNAVPVPLQSQLSMPPQQRQQQGSLAGDGNLEIAKNRRVPSNSANSFSSSSLPADSRASPFVAASDAFSMSSFLSSAYSSAPSSSSSSSALPNPQSPTHHAHQRVSSFGAGGQAASAQPSSSSSSYSSAPSGSPHHSRTGNSNSFGAAPRGSWSGGSGSASVTSNTNCGGNDSALDESDESLMAAIMAADV